MLKAPTQGENSLRIYADLHIHSHYSGATSEKMNIPEIVGFAAMKGLRLLGTGDALHPKWLKELNKHLEEIDGAGIYKPRASKHEILFMAQTEVATVHKLSLIHI